jgi:hypothetical protein
LRGRIYWYSISIHLKSGLIREVDIDERGLTREGVSDWVFVV